MKRLSVALAAVTVLSSSTVLAITSSADAAINCSINRSKGNYSTTVYNSTCWQVNARLDYYDAGFHTDYGGWSTSSSMANGGGSASGHFSNKALQGAGGLRHEDGWSSF